MKFKGEILSPSLLKRRLRAFYREASEDEIQRGIDGYDNMRGWCEGVADSYGLELFKVVGIFAAFSPQMAVDANKRLCLQFIRTGRAKHYGVLNAKAERILNAKESEVPAILNGPKISAFYWNILHPIDDRRVTIDRHALACVLQTPKKVKALDDGVYQMTKLQFMRFEQVYMDVAKEFDIAPCQLQAILWETYRRLRSLRDYEDVPF